MIVYAESSAVTAWLVREPNGGTAERVLSRAERVVASTLTMLECSRAIARHVVTGRLEPDAARVSLQFLQASVTSWGTLEMTGGVLDRAMRAFPVEPVRTLDALHLATALEFQAALGELTMLSLDERIRANAAALGLPVAP